jgi:hypothetical protein
MRVQVLFKLKLSTEGMSAVAVSDIFISEFEGPLVISEDFVSIVVLEDEDDSKIASFIDAVEVELGEVVENNLEAVIARLHSVLDDSLAAKVRQD